MTIDNLDTVRLNRDGAGAAAPGECVRTPANDNGVAGGIADTTAMAGHPAVAEVVQATLIRRGRRPDDLPDDVAEVVARAIAAARRGPMPGSLEEWKALTPTIAERYAIDANRMRGRRGKVAVGLCEDADLHGPLEIATPRDPVDTRRLLAVLTALFDAGQMPQMGAEILWGVAEGVTQKEIGQETGLTKRQVDFRLARMRALFRARLEEIGMLDEKSTSGVVPNRPVAD